MIPRVLPTPREITPKFGEVLGGGHNFSVKINNDFHGLPGCQAFFDVIMREQLCCPGYGYYPLHVNAAAIESRWGTAPQKRVDFGTPTISNDQWEVPSGPVWLTEMCGVVRRGIADNLQEAGRLIDLLLRDEAPPPVTLDRRVLQLEAPSDTKVFLLPATLLGWEESRAEGSASATGTEGLISTIGACYADCYECGDSGGFPAVQAC